MRGVRIIKVNKHIWAHRLHTEDWFDPHTLNKARISNVVTIQDEDLPDITKNENVTYLHVGGIHRSLEVSLPDIVYAARHLVNPFVKTCSGHVVICDDGDKEDLRAVAFAFACLKSHYNNPISPFFTAIQDAHLYALPQFAWDTLTAEFE